MIDNEKGNIERVIMAGVDAITKTAESAGELLEEFAKKSVLPVEHGKILNEELKHERSEADE